MKRFFDDDPEEDLFNDEMDYEEMEHPPVTEFSALISKDQLMGIMGGLELEEAKLNQALLERAINMAEKGTWFWSFRSLEYQLTKIQTIYLTLIGILTSVDQHIKAVQDNMQNMQNIEGDNLDGVL